MPEHNHPNANQTENCNYGTAILLATRQAMQADDGVFVYGLGVDDSKGHYGSTLNLHHEFGRNRCFDMPLSEDAMTGIGIGSALAGMRPIFVHQRMDFLLLCMNQLVNMAAKIHYISNGHQRVPMVVRASIGRSWGQGAQHSQSLYSYFCHIPGLKVVAPTTPHDAKIMMSAAIFDNNPVIFVEHRALYSIQGHVPVAPIRGEFGQARVLERGSDITLLGVSYAIMDCLRARQLLAEQGINAEVIDPVSLYPLDIETIVASVKKTGRLLVVDNDWLSCGLSAEIITQLVERGLGHCVLARMGFAPTPCPTTQCLEHAFYPSPVSVARHAYKLIKGNNDNYNPQPPKISEIESFKGPF